MRKIIDLETKYTHLVSTITTPSDKSIVDIVKAKMNPYTSIDEALTLCLDNGVCLDLHGLGYILVCPEDDGVSELLENFSRGIDTTTPFVYFPLGKTTQDVYNWLQKGCPQIKAQRAKGWAF